MWLSVVAKYLRLTWLIFLANVTSAMSLRVSFLMYMAGATIFYIGNFCLWIIYFNQFPSVGGWQMPDVALISALLLLSYSTIDVFVGGVNDLARIISAGNLDYFLVFPKPVLWHVATSKSDVISISSILLSFGMFLYSGDITLQKIFAFLLAACFSTILYFNFFVISQSLAFFMGNIEQATMMTRRMMETSARYSPSIFPSPFRYLLMTIIPTFFVFSLPADLVRTFSLTTFTILLLASIISSFVAHFVFTQGLKRYESGNLITIRM